MDAPPSGGRWDIGWTGTVQPEHRPDSRQAEDGRLLFLTRHQSQTLHPDWLWKVWQGLEDVAAPTSRCRESQSLSSLSSCWGSSADVRGADIDWTIYTILKINLKPNYQTTQVDDTQPVVD